MSIRSLVACLLGLLLCSQVALSSSAAEPPVTTLVVVPGDKMLMAASQAGISICRLPSLEPLGEPWKPLAVVQQIRFAPTGQHLLVAGGVPAESGMVQVYSWPDLKLLHSFPAGNDLVMDAGWLSPSVLPGSTISGYKIAAVGMDKRLRVFELKTGTEIRSAEGHSRGVTSLVLLDGGQQLVTAGLDNSLRLWRHSPTAEVEIVMDNHRDGVLDLALRPGRQPRPMVLSVSADRTVRFWQPTIGRMVRFASLPARPLAGAWLNGGRFAAVVASDGQLRVIDPESVKVTWQQQAIDGWAYCLVVLTDRQKVVVGGDRGQLVLLTIPQDSQQ